MPKETTKSRNNQGSAKETTCGELEVLTEHMLKRIEVLESRNTSKEQRIKELEEILVSTQAEITLAKREIAELKESLTFSQGEQDELKGRVDTNENDQSKLEEQFTEFEIYNRRWNLIFHGIKEEPNESCAKEVLKIVEEDLQIDVENIRFCGVHRLGRKDVHGRKTRSESLKRARPIIARFTCREDRDKVWKNKYKLKELKSKVIIADDVPAKVREQRRKYLVPALKKIKREHKYKRIKVTIVGDKLLVDGRMYRANGIPKKWLSSEVEIETEDG